MPQKQSEIKTKREILRIDGRLKEVVTFLNPKGETLHKVIHPLMLEFRPKDILQIIVGAFIVAVPLSYTEELWKLGETLPINNIYILMVLSFIFISLFIYYNYYRENLQKHWFEFVKRVLSTYVLTFGVVGLFLLLIEQAAWDTEPLIAFKRTVLVAFPASMSATIADIIK